VPVPSRSSSPASPALQRLDELAVRFDDPERDAGRLQRLGDVPANPCAMLTAAATTHSVNSSREPVLATCHGAHGNRRRPTTRMKASKPPTWASVTRIVSAVPRAGPGAASGRRAFLLLESKPAAAFSAAGKEARTAPRGRRSFGEWGVS